mmetsp:Transcript_103124/g.298319  ORF Transcript_103124/g.298319 Transcript_103124/m.298319 type:complete len:445 (-) Transcript_103124:1292-2626(-)
MPRRPLCLAAALVPRRHPLHPRGRLALDRRSGLVLPAPLPAAGRPGGRLVAHRRWRRALLDLDMAGAPRVLSRSAPLLARVPLAHFGRVPWLVPEVPQGIHPLALHGPEGEPALAGAHHGADAGAWADRCPGAEGGGRGVHRRRGWRPGAVGRHCRGGGALRRRRRPSSPLALQRFAGGRRLPRRAWPETCASLRSVAHGHLRLRPVARCAVATHRPKAHVGGDGGRGQAVAGVAAVRYSSRRGRGRPAGSAAALPAVVGAATLELRCGRCRDALGRGADGGRVALGSVAGAPLAGGGQWHSAGRLAGERRAAARGFRGQRRLVPHAAVAPAALVPQSCRQVRDAIHRHGGVARPHLHGDGGAPRRRLRGAHRRRRHAQRGVPQHPVGARLVRRHMLLFGALVGDPKCAVDPHLVGRLPTRALVRAGVGGARGVAIRRFGEREG